MARWIKRKRFPYGSGKTQNFPNCEDMTGSRLFLTGTVGQIKRKLSSAKIPVKKVRISGSPGIVEVVYTQYRGRQGPSGPFWNDKENRITSPNPWARRKYKKGCHPSRWPRV